ncbi:class I SAM-dependent methyltransferase [Thiocystis violacea]|uniref:class I SAM-dependent methyltransferase n=1 Tax=Thiocystis violacea TaxID=13725 RepID=UPI00190618C4|nr:class I SAM-dependent methyltransferase [Thiocystis violacea]MBK1724445.1 methyltransferase type 11 [Thiocystis violacea]
MPRVDTDRFYRYSLEQYGHTAKGVQWHSTDSQFARFEALRRCLPEDLSTLSLVDAGCGLGDFHRFLETRGERPGRYLGLDVVEPMVEAARLHSDAEILLLDVLHDPLPPADYYVCSGAMNTLTREETRTFIERCFMACTEGFVFNLLQGRDAPHSYNLCLPEEVRAWTAHLEAEIAITDDYLPDDFTVALRRRR